jgi:threonine dehydratase
VSSVGIDEIRAAAERFDASIRRTPLLRCITLSQMVGAEVWLKAENLQRTGSFKIRGATNRISALTADERARGVAAASAGNHAQGVAVAAAAQGVRSTVVMPVATPLAKVEATRAYGADVVLYGESYEEAHDEADRLAAERGLVIIPGFDDPLIVAGQGTIALEVIDDLPEVDVIVVPVGGGGLAAGIAVGAKELAPRARVVGVQVDAAPGAKRSIEAGRRVVVHPQPTIAEGIAVGGPGELTFPLLQRWLDDIVIVNDDEIAQAMVLLIERSKLVVEGAGAAGVAALIAKRIDVEGRKVVVVLSGGNVDINMVARVVEHGLTHSGRYLSLTAQVDDKPGQLARLLAVIGEAGANVLSVSHQRFGIDMPVGRVQVELLLEVRNRDHAAEVASELERAGFARVAGGGPAFVQRGAGEAGG